MSVTIVSTPSLPFVSYYIFILYLDHRPLHSFPTRRSSDLRLLQFALCCSRSAPRASPAARQLLSRSASRWLWRRSRSEEHTSELQSLTNLVCRLLLEKKKSTEIWFDVICEQCIGECR